MFKYFLAMTVLLVPLSQASNTPYPTFGACNKEIINIIRNVFWPLGTPNNVLEKVEEQNGYLAMFTTFTELDGIKCVRVNASAERSKMEYVFYKLNGGEPRVLSYDMEGEGPVLTSESGKTKVYTIILNDSLMASYVCSPNGDPKKPPLIFAFTSTKFFNNPVVKNTAQTIISVMSSILGEGVASLFKSLDQCVYG